MSPIVDVQPSLTFEIKVGGGGEGEGGEFEVLLIRFDFPRKVLTVIAFTRLRFTGAAGPFVID
jgi:hypothetical protein